MSKDKKIEVVDLFAGAGGASTGITRAVKAMGRELELTAVDQWPIALETHRRNHPQANHINKPVHECYALDYVLRDLDLLWASPPCTAHSRARGGGPCDHESREEAWWIFDWIESLNVKRIIVENVPEFTRWGPLGDDGRPIPSRAGETFQRFVRALKAHGYRVDWRILCAADYGDPTSRRRLFIQAAKKNESGVNWPPPTHTETPDMFCSRPWRAASDIIDWGIRGIPTTRRKKPPCDATIARIESGILRYWGMAESSPFLVSFRGPPAGGSIRRLNKPVPTIMAQGVHDALVAPIPGRRCKTARDVEYRFLRPHELAAAQGFPADYYFLGTKTDQVKQIGNAVPVNTAAALCRAVLEDIQ